MTKVLGTKLSTLWTRINTVLVPRQATVTTTGSYHIVTLQNAVTPTPDALVSFSIPASSGGSGDSNQNAFSNVKVGSSTISATAVTDTFSVTAGDNISLSVNSKTLTISAANDKVALEDVANLESYGQLAPIFAQWGNTTADTRLYDPSGMMFTTIAGTQNGSDGKAELNLGNNKGSTSAGWKQGILQMWSSVGGLTRIFSGATSFTNTRTITFPDNSGIVALTSDIPSAYTTTISTVTSGTASIGNSSNFARGDHVHNITTATITNALGYTPYSAANPNGYTSNTGTVTAVKINNTTKTASSGVVDIGTVLTTYTYTLPTASTTTLGGVKIGNGLNIGTTGVVSANVQSVNTKTGAITLTAADVGALPSSTIVPTQTSQLQNNSGFLTSAVTSLNSKTGTVTITAGDNVTVSSTSNTITISATDTKNTAGATNTSSKIYLIGTTTTTINPQTYTVTGNSLYYDSGLYSHVYHSTGESFIQQTNTNIKLTGNDAGYGKTTTLTVSPYGVSLSGDNPKITGLAIPTTNTEATNKEYVDNKLKIQNVYSNFYSADNNWATVSAVASSLNIGDDGRCYYIAVTNLTTTAAVQLNIPTNVVAPVFALCGSVDSTSGDSTIHTVVAAVNGKINIPAVTSGSFSMIAQYATPN